MVSSGHKTRQISPKLFIAFFISTNYLSIKHNFFIQLWFDRAISPLNKQTIRH
jgi:hypothetical protein